MLISGHVQLVTFWSREAVTVFLEPKMSLRELAADVYVLTRYMLIHLFLHHKELFLCYCCIIYFVLRPALLTLYCKYAISHYM